VTKIMRHRMVDGTRWIPVQAPCCFCEADVFLDAIIYSAQFGELNAMCVVWSAAMMM